MDDRNDFSADLRITSTCLYKDFFLTRHLIACEMWNRVDVFVCELFGIKALNIPKPLNQNIIYFE